jgi:hypothetical protein
MVSVGDFWQGADRGNIDFHQGSKHGGRNGSDKYKGGDGGEVYYVEL